jgi:hypothetical protein
MRHPGAVVAVAGLALLVGAHLGQRRLVGGGSFLIGICAAMPPIANAPRRWQVWIRAASRSAGSASSSSPGWRSGSTKSRCARELLDVAEDVVPAAAVEADDAVAQLVQDLVHLERGEQGLDQHRALIVPCGEPQARSAKSITSSHSARLACGSRASAGRSTGRCRARQRASRCGRRTGRSRTGADRAGRRAQVLLVEVPAARAHDQHRGRLGLQRVGLALGRVNRSCARDRVAQVDLAAITLSQPGGASPRSRP